MHASAPQISLSMLSPFSSASESGKLLQSPDSETPNSTPILSQAERKSKRVSSLGSMAMAMGFRSKQPSSTSSNPQPASCKPKNASKGQGSGNRALEAAASMLGLVKNPNSAFKDSVTASTSLLSPTSEVNPTSRRASVAIVSGQPLLSGIEAVSTIDEGDETTSFLDGSQSSNNLLLQYHHKPRLTVEPLLLKPAMQSCLKNAYRLSLPNGIGGGTSLVEQSQLETDSSTSIGVLPYPTPSIIFPTQNTLFQVGSDLSSSTSNVEVDPAIAHLDFRNHCQTILELDEQRRASDPDVKSAFEKELFEWLDTEGKVKSSGRSSNAMCIDEELVGNSNSGQWINHFNGGEDGTESEMDSQGYRADVDDFDSPCLGSEQYRRGSRIHTHATRRPMSGRRSAAEVSSGLESQEIIPKALKAPRFRGTVTEIVSNMPSSSEEERASSSTGSKGKVPQSPKSSAGKNPASVSPPPRPIKSRARGVTLSATGSASDFDYSFHSRGGNTSSSSKPTPRKQKFSDPFASLDPFSSNHSPALASSGSQNLSNRARAISSPNLLQHSSFQSSAHKPLCKPLNQHSGPCCPTGSHRNAPVGRLHTRRPPGLQLASLPKASLWAPVEIKANGGSLAGRDMKAPAVVDPRLEDKSRIKGSVASSRERKFSSVKETGIGLGLGLGLRANHRAISMEPLRPPRRISTLRPSNTVDNPAKALSTAEPASSTSIENRSVSAAVVPSVIEPPSKIEEASPTDEIGLGFSPSIVSRARSVTVGAFAKGKARDDEKFPKRAEMGDGKGITSTLFGLSLPLPMKGLNAPLDSSPSSDSEIKKRKHRSLPARVMEPQLPSPVETPFIHPEESHLDSSSKNAMQLWVSETMKATKALGSLRQGRKVVEAPATARSGITADPEKSPEIRLIPIKLVKSFKSPTEASEDENSLLFPVKSPVVQTIRGALPSPTYQLAPPSCAITLNSSSSCDSSTAPLVEPKSQAGATKVPLAERERRNASSSMPLGSSHGKEAEWFKSTPSPLMMSTSKFQSYASNSPNPTADLAKSLGLCHLVSPEAQKKISPSPQLGISSPRFGSPHPLRQASRFQGSDSEEEEGLLSEEEAKARPELSRWASTSSSINHSSDELMGESRSNLNTGSPLLSRRSIRGRNTSSRRPLTAPSRSPSTRLHPADRSPLLSRRDSYGSVGSMRMVRETSSSSFGSFKSGIGNEEPQALQRQVSSPLISFPSPLGKSTLASRGNEENSGLNRKLDSPLLINLASPFVDHAVEGRRQNLGLSLTRSIPLHIDLSASTASSDGKDLIICQQGAEDSSASSSSSSSSDSNGDELKPEKSSSSLSASLRRAVSNPVRLTENALEERLLFSAISRAKLASRVATPFSQGFQLGEGMEEVENEVSVEENVAQDQISPSLSLSVSINCSNQSDAVTPASEEGAVSILSGTTAV